MSLPKTCCCAFRSFPILICPVLACSLALLLAACLAFATSPADAARNFDAVIQNAIAEDRIPGAVLLVGHEGKIVFEKAYGHRALEPAQEPMTLDTIFDIASLTKVVATTSCAMRLVEDGKLRLNAKITDYLPEFLDGKSDITIRDLLTHYSGLRPDLDLIPPWSGYETGINLALHDKPATPPEVKFVYSDINFVLLGEIVRRLSGQSLADYSTRILFAPLGMTDTQFNPPVALKGRIAPTEKLGDGRVLRGLVHDPTSRNMGGIAGHAGVFSTARDLAKFCQMLLNQGRISLPLLDAKARIIAAPPDPVFSPRAVALFTSPASPVSVHANGSPAPVRGLGWDIDSPFSGNRGDLFPVGKSFGHTGFTGTSIWIDPTSQTYVILLSNAVHPHVRPAITSLRGRVASIAAATWGTPAGISSSRAVAAEVLTGLDVLEKEKFRDLQGKRLGLITNQTGIDRQGRRNIDVMQAAGLKIVRIFSPEHGIAGKEDQPNVEDTVDSATRIPVTSLMRGDQLRPTAEMLKGLDLLVFDIAEAGARFYTYVSTMAYCMEEAAKAKISFMVLDRPNPITGIHVEGPILDLVNISFVGYFPMPVRHGMTVGELAQMFNTEKRLGTDLTVIRMEGWRRELWFDETGLSWVNPSPNLRSLNGLTLYPAVGMLEYSTNYSVGRGTDSPFEWIGAPFIKGVMLARELNSRGIPGVSFYPVSFRPVSSNLAGKTIEGVRFTITDRNTLDAGQLGLQLADALRKLYPGQVHFAVSRRLIGSEAVVQGLEQGKPVDELSHADAESQTKFRRIRQNYLLY